MTSAYTFLRTVVCKMSTAKIAEVREAYFHIMGEIDATRKVLEGLKTEVARRTKVNKKDAVVVVFSNTHIEKG